MHVVRSTAKLCEYVAEPSCGERSVFVDSNGERCGDRGEMEKLTKEHRNPLSKGGCNYAYNLQPMCRKHNSAKNNKIQPDVHPSLFDRKVDRKKKDRNGV